jgi:hypothetical protein
MREVNTLEPAFLGVVMIPHVSDEFCVATQPADDFELKI